MIEPTGYTALDLVGFTDRGTFAANVNYVKNDLVHYAGNIWRVLLDDTIGITPAEGTNYTLFVGEPTNLVERIIAPLEDNPATVAYQTGRQIIYNDYLYEVIQDIAVGDVLIAYEDDPTNANIKLAPPVETQVLGHESRIAALEGLADDKVLFLKDKTCSAMTGNFLSEIDADITSDHVVVDVAFANPSAITTDVTWHTYDYVDSSTPTLTFNGTCASATTATITLVKKDN